jgi:hypothetical protein
VRIHGNEKKPLPTTLKNRSYLGWQLKKVATDMGKVKVKLSL